MICSPVDLALVDEDSSAEAPNPSYVHVFDRRPVPRGGLHPGHVPESLRHGARADVSPLEVLGLDATARCLGPWYLPR